MDCRKHNVLYDRAIKIVTVVKSELMQPDEPFVGPDLPEMHAIFIDWLVQGHTCHAGG